MTPAKDRHRDHLEQPTLTITQDHLDPSEPLPQDCRQAAVSNRPRHRIRYVPQSFAADNNKPAPTTLITPQPRDPHTCCITGFP